MRRSSKRVLSGMMLAGALVMGLAITNVTAGAQAQPAAQPQAGQQQAQKLTFEGDTALWTVSIKPDKTADFEKIIAKLHEGLNKSEKPERKQQAAGWKIFKSPDPAGANVLYVFIIDPSVKTADYQISNILVEGFGNTAETNAILKKYADAYAQGMNIVNLNLIQDLGK